MTLAAWLDSGGRTAVLSRLGEATKRTYSGHLELRIVPDLGYRRMDAITAAHVEVARDAWLRDGLSPSTVNGTLNCLARVFNQAMKARVLEVSPMLKVERPRPSAPVTIPTLSPVEVERLAAACQRVHESYADYVRLAAHLGLRAGELTALRPEDVDLPTGLVTVRRAHSAGVLQTTKSGRVRQVVITDAIRPTLERLVGGRPKSSPLLLGPLGGGFNHANFREAVDWVRLVTGLGWAGFRFHDLRATAIVGWIRAGVPLAVVREMAGHASLSTTDRYARLARNDLAAAASAINSYIRPYTAPGQDAALVVGSVV
ncbi:MAG: tyrosine-type recombinase/integrase [Propionicimonas sp.]